MSDYAYTPGVDFAQGTHWIVVHYKGATIAAAGDFDDIDKARAWGESQVDSHKRMTRLSEIPDQEPPPAKVGDDVVDYIVDECDKLANRLIKKLQTPNTTEEE